MKMSSMRKAATTAWAIKFEGAFWPWTGGMAYRTRQLAIENWTRDSGRTWQQWYRRGTRVVRVRITELRHAD